WLAMRLRRTRRMTRPSTRCVVCASACRRSPLSHVRSSRHSNPATRATILCMKRRLVKRCCLLYKFIFCIVPRSHTLAAPRPRSLSVHVWLVCLSCLHLQQLRVSTLGVPKPPRTELTFVAFCSIVSRDDGRRAFRKRNATLRTAITTNAQPKKKNQQLASR